MMPDAQARLALGSKFLLAAARTGCDRHRMPCRQHAWSGSNMVEQFNSRLSLMALPGSQANSDQEPAFGNDRDNDLDRLIGRRSLLMHPVGSALRTVAKAGSPSRTAPSSMAFYGDSGAERHGATFCPSMGVGGTPSIIGSGEGARPGSGRP